MRAAAIQHVQDYFDTGRFARDLATWVAVPSESQRADAGSDLRAYLTEVLVPRLAASGFDCAVHDNDDPAGGPFLVAQRREGEDLPTVLSYGHGDVVPGQAGDWSGGRDPFALSDGGDRFYGRGTADNKGQHLINIAAVEAVLAVRGALGFNLTFLIEMSEEVGSPGLAAFCAARSDLLGADVLIASDGPRLAADTPTVFTGARGAVNFDLTVRLRDRAHHSGNWGGLLADPAMVLAQALACITDARGTILVPEWRPDSLTDKVRAVLADLPVAGGDAQWGEAGLSAAERVLGWNAFAVLAMTSGQPDAPMNAIAGAAWAQCQLRFVVGTDAADILPALRRHLDAHGFDGVDITPQGVAFAATRAAPGDPWVAFALRSIKDTTGHAAHLVPNLGGSLPNECFTDVLGMPTVWVPHSYAGCNQHGPDEHVLKSICREGLAIMAGLWWDVGG